MTGFLQKSQKWETSPEHLDDLQNVQHRRRKRTSTLNKIRGPVIIIRRYSGDTINRSPLRALILIDESARVVLGPR